MIVLFSLLIAVLYTYSYKKAPEKTVFAVKKAGKNFLYAAPQLLGYFAAVSLSMAVIKIQSVINCLGSQHGWAGPLVAAMNGSFLMGSSWFGIPIAGSLISRGAGSASAVAFLSVWTTIGLFSLPKEIRLFGWRLALFRNIYALIISLVSAMIIGVLYAEIL